MNTDDRVETFSVLILTELLNYLWCKRRILHRMFYYISNYILFCLPSNLSLTVCHKLLTQTTPQLVSYLTGYREMLYFNRVRSQLMMIVKFLIQIEKNQLLYGIFQFQCWLPHCHMLKKLKENYLCIENDPLDFRFHSLSRFLIGKQNFAHEPRVILF